MILSNEKWPRLKMLATIQDWLASYPMVPYYILRIENIKPIRVYHYKENMVENHYFRGLKFLDLVIIWITMFYQILNRTFMIYNILKISKCWFFIRRRNLFVDQSIFNEIQFNYRVAVYTNVFPPGCRKSRVSTIAWQRLFIFKA